MKKDKNILSFSTASKKFDYKIYISWEEAMKDKNVIPCGLVPKNSKISGKPKKSNNPSVKSILLDFIAKQEKFNDEQRKFNEYVISVFKANNLKY